MVEAKYDRPYFVDKVKKEWEKIAKENLEVEEIKGTVYAYGSELATLRLLKKFIKSGDKAKADFSTNLKKFYFRLAI